MIAVDSVNLSQKYGVSKMGNYLFLFNKLTTIDTNRSFFVCLHHKKGELSLPFYRKQPIQFVN